MAGSRRRGQKGEGRQDVATPDVIKAIEHALVEQGRSRSWLAEQAGCDPSNVTKVLQVGKRSAFITKFAEALGLAHPDGATARHPTAMRLLDRLVRTSPDRYHKYLQALADIVELEEKAEQRILGLTSRVSDEEK